VNVQELVLVAIYSQRKYEDQSNSKVKCMTRRLLCRMMCLVYVNLYYCRYIAWLEGIYEHAIVKGWMQLYTDCLPCILESLKSKVDLNNIKKSTSYPQEITLPYTNSNVSWDCIVCVSQLMLSDKIVVFSENVTEILGACGAVQILY
jgi:hypothetical protein